MEDVALIADSNGVGYDFVKGIFKYLKSKENDDFSVSLIDVEKKFFRDGEFKIKIGGNIRGKRCFIIYDPNKNPSEWFTELVFLLEATTFSSPEEINLVLPYTRFARQDRKDESRVSVNVKALADVVSLYADRGLTVDLHTPQIQEYFSIPFDNLYSMISLINHVQKHHQGFLKDLVIVSPDLGGGKRADYLVKKLKERGIESGVAFGHKNRDRDNEVSKTVIIGDVAGKNCLIVDDIIDTGNTLIMTANKLREKGAKGISAYCTHGLFTEGVDKFRVFDRVFISDTIKPPVASNIEVVSLVRLFGEAIYRTATGLSLSVLFENVHDNNQHSLENYDI